MKTGPERPFHPQIHPDSIPTTTPPDRFRQRTRTRGDEAWRRAEGGAGGARGDEAAARGDGLVARHISPDGYHHDGDRDRLPFDVDAPRPLLADPSCTGSSWRR